MYYNSIIFAYSYNEHFCENIEKNIFVEKLYYFDFICKETGSGNQTVLILGDRSARELLHGIRYHFSEIYSKLVVISSDKCAPFADETFEQPECANFSRNIRELISLWPDGGIDLLFLSYQ
jgi:hypothetical protein